MQLALLSCSGENVVQDDIAKLQCLTVDPFCGECGPHITYEYFLGICLTSECICQNVSLEDCDHYHFVKKLFAHAQVSQSEVDCSDKESEIEVLRVALITVSAFSGLTLLLGLAFVIVIIVCMKGLCTKH